MLYIYSPKDNNKWKKLGEQMHCGEIYGHYMKKVSGVISALYPDFERKKKA